MQYFSKTYQSLINLPSFTLSNVTAVIGALLGAIGTVIAIWPLIKQRRTERLLERSFGADFYDAATIERATRYYVRPNCTSVDPASEAEVRQVISTEEDLFSAVARHLNQDTLHRHLLLLVRFRNGEIFFRN